MVGKVAKVEKNRFFVLPFVNFKILITCKLLPQNNGFFQNLSSKLNIILIISFSISVNSFILFPNFNNAFYILFHLTLIYLIFYHYHFSIYVLALIYGILFDILLLNNIGAHLITFLSLLILFCLEIFNWLSSVNYIYLLYNISAVYNWTIFSKSNTQL